MQAGLFVHENAKKPLADARGSEIQFRVCNEAQSRDREGAVAISASCSKLDSLTLRSGHMWTR
jgi:hypothetical protein